MQLGLHIDILKKHILLLLNLHSSAAASQLVLCYQIGHDSCMAKLKKNVLHNTIYCRTKNEVASCYKGGEKKETGKNNEKNNGMTKE
jgi:hypothetical protein